MSKKETYREILVLAALLTKKGIKFEIEKYLDGYHIGYPTLYKPKLSIIEHFASYGTEYDLLEFMEGDQIHQGWTALQVLEYIEEKEKKSRR